LVLEIPLAINSSSNILSTLKEPKMCGRFAQVIKHDQLQKLSKELKFRITTDQLELSYNVAPTQPVMAIVAKDGLRYTGVFRWGLVPSWMKELPKTAIINVRAESIHEKPSFKASFIRRRTIVPVNGFYEWRNPDKTPHFIHSAKDDLLYLGAIYDVWESNDGSYLPSLGIITTAANDFMSKLHHRMPLILNDSDIDAFLDPQNQDIKNLRTLLQPASEHLLLAHPVSRNVNKVSVNAAFLIEEVKPDNQLEIF